jgi:hypothetical protein
MFFCQFLKWLEIEVLTLILFLKIPVKKKLIFKIDFLKKSQINNNAVQVYYF